MMSDSLAAETALARNLLSSVLALAIPSDVEHDCAALEALQTQQTALRDALKRHNVFGLVVDGKALAKWDVRLLQLVEGSSVARRVGWELLLTTTRQSPLDRLEAQAVKLLERIVKGLKQQQSSKSEDDDAEQATAAACGVAQALLLHVDRFNPDTRRDVLELLGKLLQPLVALLASKRHTSSSTLVAAQLDLIASLLRASPNSLRSFAVKIEVACVGVLFPAADGSDDKEEVAHKATVCLALLCNASDKPQQVWTQLAQKALEAAHQQLDLLAGKRSVVPSTEGVTGKKLWVQGTASQQLPIYQRAEVTLIRMVRALCVLHELLSARSATQSRGQISEREVQQVLPEVLVFARRAMAVRAHEVGKHTGVSDDGVRLPVSVVYAVLPRVHAQSLRILSAVVERTGICALRRASKITRVLLLASESVGDGEDLQALADATAICARRLGASTVEKLGVPLLNELVTRCKHSFDEKKSSATTSNTVARALAVHQNDAKHGGSKSKKRKRQAAAAATLAALNGGNVAAGQSTFVSLRDERVVALTVEALLTAIAGCVGVYGSLLPEECRSSASDVVLKAVQRRHVIGSSHVHAAIDPVSLALLSDAVSVNSTGSHASNLLHGIQYWQRRVISSGGGSSALQLVALSAGEALLHPRAPPMAINFQQGASKEQEINPFDMSSKAMKESAIQGDAMDWDENEQDESDDEDSQVDQDENLTEASTKPEASIITEKEEKEEEEEGYDDARPQASETATLMDVDEEKTDSKEGDDDEGDNEPPMKRARESDADKKPVAMVEADDDDDDFPDIIVDDD
ncbi:hypothetical protein PHMEG_00011973 [Phytophthora megakarya]|uniref:Pre-rRNA-processing protein RIX1 N-terminal domain-containing protein n=1 Tax=Phytophthora megakarya TaxID=4795 RepID=A0A225WAW2_9STRA|nr:hypothetical protein PHMEG_00011973 [Phytophthora megakarya]